MNNTNRQILSVNGRSTKKEKAGLSLLRPRLIEIIGDNYVYFNEILQNICTTIVNVISKPVSKIISSSVSFDESLLSINAQKYSQKLIRANKGFISHILKVLMNHRDDFMSPLDSGFDFSNSYSKRSARCSDVFSIISRSGAK